MVSDRSAAFTVRGFVLGHSQDFPLRGFPVVVLPPRRKITVDQQVTFARLPVLNRMHHVAEELLAYHGKGFPSVVRVVTALRGWTLIFYLGADRVLKAGHLWRRVEAPLVTPPAVPGIWPQCVPTPSDPVVMGPYLK